jgi:hypothetical protein
MLVTGHSEGSEDTLAHEFGIFHAGNLLDDHAQ